MLTARGEQVPGGVDRRPGAVGEQVLQRAQHRVLDARALPCPMTSDSWPRTAATTMSTGKVVSTAMKAFSPARPSTRSRSHLRTMSATSRACAGATARGAGAGPPPPRWAPPGPRGCAGAPPAPPRTEGPRAGGGRHAAMVPQDPADQARRRACAQGESQHPVVVALGVAAPVAVAGGTQSAPSGARTDGPQPPVLAREPGRGLAGAAAAVERDLPQPLAAQRRDPERAAGDGDAARARLDGAPR